MKAKKKRPKKAKAPRHPRHKAQKWPAEEVSSMPTKELVPHAHNARTHSTQQVAQIAASIKEWGWTVPILVDEAGGVLAGHGRLLAAEVLGIEEVPCMVARGWTKAQKRAYVIADNQLTINAGWDVDLLKIEVGALKSLDFDLDLLGFDASALGSILKIDDGSPDDIDPSTLLRDDAVTQDGDVWVLGDHRLLCGDSTVLKDVKRIMGRDKAALVATDPPYLVDYTGERPNNSGKDWTDSYREIDIKDADGFFRAVFKNMLEAIGPKAAIYCWHAHKRLGEIQSIWRDLGILDHQQIVWIKPTPVFGRAYWLFRHEPCIMGWKKGSKPKHDGKHDYDSVWIVDWDGKARISTDHPTSKPVELFTRPMKKHTKHGDIVFEPFSGSGTQIIAAERTGRRCRAIEISPIFVDVAVRRWQQKTGREATLEGKGDTFDEVARVRGVAEDVFG